RNAVRRRDGTRLDVKAGKLQLVFHRVHDFHADIDGVSNRLLIPVEIAEGHRSFLEAEYDPVRLLDFLKRPGQLACVRRDGEQDNGKHGQWQTHYGGPHRAVNGLQRLDGWSIAATVVDQPSLLN